MLVVFYSWRISYAQNLVPNGDFEQHVACPSYLGQIHLATPWANPANLNFNATPDYLHACATSYQFRVPANVFGYQPAHSGDAYTGIVTYGAIGTSEFREYLEVQLLSPLSPNTCYHFEMYVSLGETYSGYTTDDFGAYFSDSLITGIAHHLSLPYGPQVKNPTGTYPDTSGWLISSGEFTAAGGEQYMLIGNFRDNTQTDTVSLNLSNPYKGVYFFIDDVSLTPCVGISEYPGGAEIRVFPNPVDDWMTVTVDSPDAASLVLYDLRSRKLMESHFMRAVTLQTGSLDGGVYFYEIRSGNERIGQGMFIKR